MGKTLLNFGCHYNYTFFSVMDYLFNLNSQVLQITCKVVTSCSGLGHSFNYPLSQKYFICMENLGNIFSFCTCMRQFCVFCKSFNKIQPPYLSHVVRNLSDTICEQQICASTQTDQPLCCSLPLHNYAINSNVYYLRHVMRKPVYVICEQQRHRSACASVQSDQCLCCLLSR